MKRKAGQYFLIVNVLIVLLSISGCDSGGETCYYCATNRPGWANVSNVCGGMMRDYYEGIGYTCVKE